MFLADKKWPTIYDCFYHDSLNIANFESYSSFLYDEQYIQAEKTLLQHPNIETKMAACKRQYIEKNIDEELDLLSIRLNTCINAREPDPEKILSDYCNYETPEEHYGEVEESQREETEQIMLGNRD